MMEVYPIDPEELKTFALVWTSVGYLSEFPLRRKRKMEIFADLPEKLKAKLSRLYPSPDPRFSEWHLDLTDHWFYQYSSRLCFESLNPRLTYLQWVLHLYSEADRDWGCICLIPLQDGGSLDCRVSFGLDHGQWAIAISGADGTGTPIFVNAT